MPTIELTKNQVAVVFDVGQENNNTTLYMPDFVIEGSKIDGGSLDAIYIYCAAITYLANDEEFVNMAIDRFNKKMSEEVEKDNKEKDVTLN